MELHNNILASWRPRPACSKKVRHSVEIYPAAHETRATRTATTGRATFNRCDAANRVRSRQDRLRPLAREGTFTSQRTQWFRRKYINT